MPEGIKFAGSCQKPDNHYRISNMKEITAYLKDIRRANLYTALFLKELKNNKVEHLEDQLCDISQTVDDQLTKIQESLLKSSFNTDSYWHDKEIQISFLYLQDLIFEFPEENPDVLAKRALSSAKIAVEALKAEFN